MKINFKKIDYLYFLIILLVTFFVWTTPLRNNLNPYGDVDAATHFQVLDYMGQKDKAVIYLPPHLSPKFSYHSDILFYPPQFHLVGSLFQIFSGERIVPVFLFFVLGSSLIIFTVFLLIKELYGNLIAFLSSFFLIFSGKNLYHSIVGQWPQTTSFGLVPLAILFFYKHFESSIENKPKNIYLYLFLFCLLFQWFVHPHGFFYSTFLVFTYGLILTVKHRRLPFDIKTGIICLILFLFFVIPFAGFLIPQFLKVGGGTGYGIYYLKYIFLWYPPTELLEGVFPINYISYSFNYGLWSLPFLLIGVLYILLKRRKQEILMFSWLFTQYFSSHLFILGFGDRALRTLNAEEAIFIPLIIIGFIFFGKFVLSFLIKKKKIVLFIVGALIFVLILFLNVPKSYDYINSAFVYRSSSSIAEVGSWIMNNIDEGHGSHLFHVGEPVLSVEKWLRVYSLHHSTYTQPIQQIIPLENDSWMLNASAIVVDYNYAMFTQNQQLVNAIEHWEKLHFNLSPNFISQDNLVRVYKNEI